MRLFEFDPAETPEGRGFMHLDLDHVVYLSDFRLNDGSGQTSWWVELSSGHGFFVTKACFDRLLRAWESK